MVGTERWELMGRWECTAVGDIATYGVDVNSGAAYTASASVGAETGRRLFKGLVGEVEEEV